MLILLPMMNNLLQTSAISGLTFGPPCTLTYFTVSTGAAEQ